MGDSTLLSVALQHYFDQNGFSEKAYTENFSRIHIGPIHYYIPNTPGRKQALRVHDLHHILNEYGTDLLGEGEIGAWEIASGVPLIYGYGLFLNASALIASLFLNPKRIFKAYLRGRKSKNLYGDFSKNPAQYDEFLKATLGETRKKLGIVLN